MFRKLTLNTFARRSFLKTIGLVAMGSLIEPMRSLAQNNFKSSASDKNNTIKLPADFQYPNGIAQATDGTLYVGSVTSGKILQITPDGNIKTFFPVNEQIFAATSLRLDEAKGILWGASPDFLGVENAKGEIVRRPHRIFAIDISTREVIRSLQMPDNGFGNDFALDENGGIYITDSFNPRIYYLAPEVEGFETWLESELFREDSDAPGLAGIARNSNGITIVGMFAKGKLLKVTPQQDSVVEVISLSRQLENPDGMQFAPDGSLLLTEAAIESGNGRLVRIDVLCDLNTKPVETLVSGLNTPVNLTILNNVAWITESRIRHRLLPGKETEIPNRFLIHRFDLRNFE